MVAHHQDHEPHEKLTFDANADGGPQNFVMRYISSNGHQSLIKPSQESHDEWHEILYRLETNVQDDRYRQNKYRCQVA